MQKETLIMSHQLIILDSTDRIRLLPSQGSGSTTDCKSSGPWCAAKKSGIILVQRTKGQEADMKSHMKSQKIKILMSVPLLVMAFATGQRLDTEVQEAPSVEDPHYAFLKSYIEKYNPAVESDESEILAETIMRHSRNLVIPETARIDGEAIEPELLVTAFIETESTFKKYAVSSANARGYMQLMHDTVRWMNVKYDTKADLNRLHDTDLNVRLGVTYLNYLFEEMKDPRLVALSYNAGPGNVSRGYYIERYWVKIRRHYRKARTEQEIAFANISEEQRLAYLQDSPEQ
jgi:hypothetical protein